MAGELGNPPTEQQPTPQSRQVMTSEEYQRQLEHLQQDFDRVKTTASQFEQDLQTGRQMPAQTMLQQPVEPPVQQPRLSTAALHNIFQPQNQAPAVDLTPGPGPRASSALLPFDDAGRAGQVQDQTAARPSNLVLTSPPSPSTGARAAASPTSGFELYGQPADTGPAAAELAAQKNRIDAIFAPRTEGAGI